MKILILPKIENRHLFAEIWDKVKNVIKIPVEQDCTIQCSNDGCWLCDKDGCVMTDGDFTPVPNTTDTEYKLHPRSGITQKDIDEFNKEQHDFGNGMSTWEFNKKPCTIIVLQEGQDVTPTQFNKIADEMERPI